MELSKKSYGNAKKTDNKSYSETIKYHEVKDTPFTIVENDEGIFGVLGNYRLTDLKEKKDIEILTEELKEITWNRIIQVMAIMENINKKK